MRICVHCQAEFEGRSDKTYCSEGCWSRANKARYRTQHLCPCGEGFDADPTHGRIYCGRRCAQQFRRGYCRIPSGHPIRAVNAQWTTVSSPLRQAIDTDDRLAIIDILASDTRVSDSGCWEWQGRLDTSGYASTNVAGKRRSVHRLMAEAYHGPLGRQSVHHACANIVCVNPDHLQPISMRENLAEMFERNYYLARIAELEAALARTAGWTPGPHPSPGR